MSRSRNPSSCRLRLDHSRSRLLEGDVRFDGLVFVFLGFSSRRAKTGIQRDESTFPASALADFWQLCWIVGKE